MFKKIQEILKKIFIYAFICLLLISSPIVQDTVIYNNVIIKTSVSSLETFKQNQFLLPYNIAFERLSIDMTNQISTLQQQGYGFIQIIFIIFAWIVRIVIFILKLILRAVIFIFSYIMRILPILTRVIMSVIKVSFRFIGTGAKKLFFLLKNGVRLFGKIVKNLFFYMRKGLIGLRKLLLKVFSKIRQSIGKISTSKKVAVGGGLGTVTKPALASTKSTPITSKNMTSKQVLPNTKNKSIPVASKTITKTSTSKIKSIRPGKQKTNLKYNKNLSPNVKKYMLSSAEGKIYQDLNLKETKINGRRILRRENAYDIYQKDIEGRTNLERMKKGLAPIDENNNSIELHHIGQKMDSPLAELKYNEHKKYFSDIHNNFEKSEIDRNVFAKEKREYWKALAKMYEENLGN